MKLDGSGFKKVGNRPTRIKYDYTVLGPEGEPFWFQGSGLMTASRDCKHERPVAKGPFEEELAITRRGKRIAVGGYRGLSRRHSRAAHPPRSTTRPFRASAGSAA